MAVSSGAVQVTTEWEDIAGSLSDVAGVKWQNVGGYPVFIAFTSSSTAPASGEGQYLAPGEWVIDAGGSTHVWARTLVATSSIAATVDPSAIGGLSAGDSTNLANVESNTGSAVTELTAIKDAVQAPVTSFPNVALADVSGMTFVPFDHNTAAAHEVLAAGTNGETIKVYGILLTFAAEVDIALSGGADALPLVIKTPGFDLLPRVGGLPLYVTAANTALTLTLGSAVRVAGGFWVKKS